MSTLRRAAAELSPRLPLVGRVPQLPARVVDLTCHQCGERPAMVANGLCLPCDLAIDRQVDAMEAHLNKRRAMRHYEAVAAEAVGAP